MKKVNFIVQISLIVLLVPLTSCEAIGGIFQAGMNFGIFIVIAILAVIIYIVMKMGRRNNS